MKQKVAPSLAAFVASVLLSACAQVHHDIRLPPKHPAQVGEATEISVAKVTRSWAGDHLFGEDTVVEEIDSRMASHDQRLESLDLRLESLSHSMRYVERRLESCATCAEEAQRTRTGGIDSSLVIFLDRLASHPAPTAEDPGERQDEGEERNGPTGVLERFLGRHTRGASESYDIEPFIVTLPDPSDSHFVREFDLFLDVLRRGFEYRGLVMDHFYLPWRIGELGGSSAQEQSSESANSGNRHQREPGLILFRQDQASAEGRLLVAVFLVGETPTWGIQRDAFVRALDIIEDWRRAEGSGECALRILGPTYSGTASSLRRALDDWLHFPARWPEVGMGPPGPPVVRCRIQVVSGTATREKNKEILEENRSVRFPLAYTTLAAENEVKKAALYDYLDRYIGIKPDKTALLVDSSAYASGYRESRREPASGSKKRDEKRRSEMILPFPMHISQIQSAWARENAQRRADRGKTTALPRRYLELDLSYANHPKELPQPYAQVLTSRTAEMVLTNIVSAIARENIEAVGIVATDVRDQLFLARAVRRRLPDLYLFALEGDVLLAHPDYARSCRGMIVASSYSHLEEDRHHRKILVFPSDLAHGMFRAVRALMHDVEKERSLALDEYPADRRRATRNVRISTVGRGALWPLRFATSRIEALTAQDGKLYAASSRGGIAVSEDHGETWKSLCDRNLTEPDQVLSLAVSEDGNTLFAGTYFGGVSELDLKACDEWKVLIWSETPTDDCRGLQRIEALAVHGGYVYAGGYSGGLCRKELESDDGWEAVPLVLDDDAEESPVSSIRSLLPIPGDPGDEDEPGSLLLVTVSEGVSELSLKDFSLKLYWGTEKKRFDEATMAGGELVLATAEGQLMSFDRSEGKLGDPGWPLESRGPLDALAFDGERLYASPSFGARWLARGESTAGAGWGLKFVKPKWNGSYLDHLFQYDPDSPGFEEGPGEARLSKAIDGVLEKGLVHRQGWRLLMVISSILIILAALRIGWDSTRPWRRPGQKPRFRLFPAAHVAKGARVWWRSLMLLFLATAAFSYLLTSLFFLLGSSEEKLIFLSAKSTWPWETLQLLWAYLQTPKKWLPPLTFALVAFAFLAAFLGFRAAGSSNGEPGAETDDPWRSRAGPIADIRWLFGTKTGWGFLVMILVIFALMTLLLAWFGQVVTDGGFFSAQWLFRSSDWLNGVSPMIPMMLLMIISLGFVVLEDHRLRHRLVIDQAGDPLVEEFKFARAFLGGLYIPMDIIKILVVIVLGLGAPLLYVNLNFLKGLGETLVRIVCIIWFVLAVLGLLLTGMRFHAGWRRLEGFLSSVFTDPAAHTKRNKKSTPLLAHARKWGPTDFQDWLYLLLKLEKPKDVAELEKNRDLIERAAGEEVKALAAMDAKQGSEDRSTLQARFDELETRVLGTFLKIMRYDLAFTIGAGIVLMLAVFSYPFQPHRLLTLWVAALLVAAGLMSLFVIPQMDRNPVLSRLFTPKEDRLSWTGGLVEGFIGFSALPLLAAAVSQIPGLQDLLAGGLTQMVRFLLF